jgi:hypothetical protein
MIYTAFLGIFKNLMKLNLSFKLKYTNTDNKFI